MEGEVVNVGGQNPQPVAGSVGLDTQLPGGPTTVSAISDATGGIAAGNFVEPDLDDQLFKFNSDDTPLMNLMLKAKKVKVNSPEVEHYMIDEPRSSMQTTTAVAAGKSQQFILPLSANDASLPRPYTTLLVKGVDGYAEDGKTATPGKELLLFVTGHDPSTNSPICRAVNGPKENSGDEYCTVPAIPASSTIIILANALYETQKEVDPDSIVPQKRLIYLQKRGMNTIVSDYFEAQRKRIPFGKAVIAEAAITNFKVKGNRTLWASRQGKFDVQTPKAGVQKVYTTEGVRYQVKKEMKKTGKWTIEEFIALAKMFFTGEDVPKSGLVLAGKNFLENIQTIDYSKHPEIQITTAVNPIGWEVTRFHTVFGDLDFKREPTLDRLKWSNSALVLAEGRLVHYVYSAEHSASDRMEGEEATRTSILVWDALALKGSCHIWIDGESSSVEGAGAADATQYVLYEGGEEAPEDPQEGFVYYMLNDCPGISELAVKGTLWVYEGSSWKAFDGTIMAV